MTTIAYFDGTMAADRQININDSTVIMSPIPKIARDAAGNVYGACGDWSSCCAVLEAVKLQAETGKPVSIPIPHRGSDYEILVAFSDGRLRHLVNGNEIILDGINYIAIGGGREVALGAMFAGAQAQVAVWAACAHHAGTGGIVDELDIIPDPEPVFVSGEPEVGLTTTQLAVERAYQEIVDSGNAQYYGGAKSSDTDAEDEFQRIASQPSN